jgi:hypothetical protein
MAEVAAAAGGGGGGGRGGALSYLVGKASENCEVAGSMVATKYISSYEVATKFCADHYPTHRIIYIKTVGDNNKLCCFLAVGDDNNP